MNSMEAARAAVARGIVVLDQHGPQGWRSKINLETLDMEDGHHCVAGQIYQEAREQVIREHQACGPFDECSHIMVIQPFDQAMLALRAATGYADQRKPSFYDFPREHGFVDFYEVRDTDSDVYVSYDALQAAWMEALSA